MHKPKPQLFVRRNKGVQQEEALSSEETLYHSIQTYCMKTTGKFMSGEHILCWCKFSYTVVTVLYAILLKCRSCSTFPPSSTVSKVLNFHTVKNIYKQFSSIKNVFFQYSFVQSGELVPTIASDSAPSKMLFCLPCLYRIHIFFCQCSLIWSFQLDIFHHKVFRPADPLHTEGNSRTKIIRYYDKSYIKKKGRFSICSMRIYDVFFFNARQEFPVLLFRWLTLTQYLSLLLPPTAAFLITVIKYKEEQKMIGHLFYDKTNLC